MTSSANLLLRVFGDVERVSVLIQLLGPASRGRPVLAVRLTRVGAVTEFLRGQRLWRTWDKRLLTCTIHLGHCL